MEEIIAVLNRKLKGWYGYFKHVERQTLGQTDSWIRQRLRSILRKRRKGRGQARGQDNVRWSNHYFARLGLFSLQQAQAEEIANLRHGANC